MTSGTYEQILVKRRGPVALLTLNRPEKLNAWTNTMAAELRDAISAADADDAVGAIVLTGAGRAYCAGFDIGAWSAELKGSGPRTGGQTTAAGDSWVHLLRRVKPVIAAVNGVAVGIGLTHILPADVRIAGESARFGCIFLRMGVMPELASTYYLSQLVGLGAAQELTLTARIFDAPEALRLGLVSRVVPDGELLDAALELAGQIAALPPPQLRMAKALFTQNATEQDLDAVIARESAALAQAYQTPEFREAVTAFMEKRPPDFRKAARAQAR
jgi:2-(1,2-epoxy-1,2-dihydrophenyl)acetyl-CoA isomerase